MKKFLIIGISVFLGFTFWGSGMAKLFFEHKFFGWIGPVWLIDELRPYGLGLYGQFIALSQIIIGYCLVTTRYKLIGSIMMIPLIGNILMVTISLNWQGTPFVLGFLLLLNFVLLWQYRDFFRPLIDENDHHSYWIQRGSRSTKGHLVWLAGLGLQIVAIPISFLNWPLSLGVVILGLIISFLSFRADKITKIEEDQIT
ncbi:hypothetical protein [Algoriphagus sediminis]|uniref:DoxX family protein n=1 Tax=Algoriphagus sediminis TaxID=3057113 RepID=A0ABT7YHD8_9BACT|nr:hypothetical protein [Algoriphagus sediminis]MDN3205924.1 hypothetical protein [Algoriphagus sediminis]